MRPEKKISRHGGVSPATLSMPSIELEELAGLADGLDDGPGGRRAVNGTAYRIFKMLQWLIESPLSVDALNERFAADPQIARTLSNDSIWLYINTLKALGCNIRRPGPRNRFQYELLHHPFGLPLTEAKLETLVLAKAHAQRQFNHQEMLVLDGLLKKIVNYATCENTPEAVSNLFAQSRSLDYELCRQHIGQLEQWIAEDRLLELAYLSPLKGRETFYFLPEFLYYEQGVVYLRGERPDFSSPSSLRVDRLESLIPIEEPQMRLALKERREMKTEVRLRLYVPDEEAFQGLGLTESHGIYYESWIWREEGGFLEGELRTRDFFYLKQKLLSCGFAFSVIAPAGFQEEIRMTLEAMRGLYSEEGEVCDGAG